jgi:hypothetical protein
MVRILRANLAAVVVRRMLHAPFADHKGVVFFYIRHEVPKRSFGYIAFREDRRRKYAVRNVL